MLVQVVNLISSAAILLLPTSHPLYEVGVEGSFALTRLLNALLVESSSGAANAAAAAAASGGESDDGESGVSYVEKEMLRITHYVSILEVFIDRLASYLFLSTTSVPTFVSLSFLTPSLPTHSLVVLVIEALKSSCRLVILSVRQSPSMLLHWGSAVSNGEGGGGGRMGGRLGSRVIGRAGGRIGWRDSGTGAGLTIAHYRQWYRTSSFCYRGPAAARAVDPSFHIPPPPSGVSPSRNATIRTGSYKGKRSGLFISPIGEHNDGSSRSDQNINGETVNKEDEAAEEQKSFISTFVPFLKSLFRQSSSSPPSSSSSSSLQSFTKATSLTAEQCLILGEVLYILRPTVYAWCIHYIDKKRQKRNDCGEESGECRGNGPHQDSGTNGRGTQRPVNTSYLIALVASLSVELLSLSLTDAALKKIRCEVDGEREGGAEAGRRPELRRQQQHAFEQELSRRRAGLAFYLLRHPLFSILPLPLLRRSSTLLASIPILSSFPPFLLQTLQYLADSHFYNSNSS